MNTNVYMSFLPSPDAISEVTPNRGSVGSQTSLWKGDVIRNSPNPFISFLVLTVPSGPPFVSLEASPEYVRGGDNINVTCTVLGEPEVDMSFTWSYPGQVSALTGSNSNTNEFWTWSQHHPPSVRQRFERLYTSTHLSAAERKRTEIWNAH